VTPPPLLEVALDFIFTLALAKWTTTHDGQDGGRIHDESWSLPRKIRVYRV
jgi:hypothetical protein